MVSTFTTNKSYEKPARGDYVGTWDTPVDGNYDKVDSNLGGLVTIALTNSPVSLSSAQYANVFIQFTGAISANIPITFPPVGSFYTIINDCTNSSNFYLTMKTSAAGGRVIGLPPGTMTQVMTDGTNARFTTLPPVGSYWDHAGSSVPAWVSACTIPPWLNCDGTTFASSTYPALAAVLGSTTLPDARGRTRFALNQGTGRVTAAGGLDGNTAYAGGGAQTVTLSSQNIPPIPVTVTDPGHTHVLPYWVGQQGGSAAASFDATAPITRLQNPVTNSNTTGISVAAGSTTPTSVALVNPSYVGGITLIRAA